MYVTDAVRGTCNEQGYQVLLRRVPSFCQPCKSQTQQRAQPWPQLHPQECLPGASIDAGRGQSVTNGDDVAKQGRQCEHRAVSQQPQHCSRADALLRAKHDEVPGRDLVVHDIDGAAVACHGCGAGLRIDVSWRAKVLRLPCRG